MSIPPNDANFFGTLLESLFYGIYLIVFSAFIWADRKKVAARTFLFYPICVLFVLVTVYIILDFMGTYYSLLYPQTAAVLFWNLKIATSAVTSFVDFISQLVLIYRCWHMWNRTWFMIIPAFLSLASLAGSLVLVGELITLLNTRNFDNVPVWWIPMGVTAFSLSLAVNTIVTGLLVLKIVLGYRLTEPSNYNSNHLNWKKNILPIIAILIETGLMTFVGQMAWTISYGLQSSVFSLVAGVVIVLYGLSPTIIQMRAVLGSSYEVSRVKSSMHFADYSKPSSSVDYLESNVKETSTMEAV